MTSFLQSREWQEIQDRTGRRTERIGSVLVIRHELPFGFHYLYAPRPEIDSESAKQVVGYAKHTGAVFLKIDPIKTAEPLAIGHWSLVTSPSRSLQPRQTLVVDVQKSEAELLAAMHPKTRYNIGVAERHGVTVKSLSRGDALASFHDLWSLFLGTAMRDGFHLHPIEHYRALFDVSSDEFLNELWCAEYEGNIVAAAIVNWHYPGGTATYLHGASSRDDRNVMAPYLLHWRLIQALGERDFRRYDFGGVDRVLWPGVTRFKSGFGANTHEFPHSADYVFRPALYRLYHFQHQLRHSHENRAINA